MTFHLCRNLRHMATCALLVIVPAMLTSNANAVIIDNGITTIDTAAGLEWLDLTQTQNRSYADVAGGFGAGGEFEGWRHATISELVSLQTNAGFAPPYFAQPVTPAFTALIDMLGRTQDGEGFDSILKGIGAVGWFDDGGSASGTSHLRFFQLVEAPFSGAQVLAQTTDSSSTSDFNVDTGNWLVRQAVPEPEGLALFGFGLVGLAYMRRKRAV